MRNQHHCIILKQTARLFSPQGKRRVSPMASKHVTFGIALICVLALAFLFLGRPQPVVHPEPAAPPSEAVAAAEPAPQPAAAPVSAPADEAKPHVAFSQTEYVHDAGEAFTLSA